MAGGLPPARAHQPTSARRQAQAPEQEQREPHERLVPSAALGDGQDAGVAGVAVQADDVTNPSQYRSVSINSAELRDYCRRTLRFTRR